MTARRPPRRKPGQMTIAEIRGLMRRGYVRPIDAVPALHQMGRPRPEDHHQDDDTDPQEAAE